MIPEFRNMDDVLNYFRAHRWIAAFSSLWILIVFILIVFKCQNFSISNAEIGYSLKPPPGWQTIFSADKKEVTFQKYKERDGHSSIALMAEMGNPYGVTAMDYLVKGVIPKIEYNPDTGNNHILQWEDAFYTEEVNGLEWAAVTFYLDNNETFIIVYTTSVNEYSLTLVLYSKGQNHERDKKLFFKTLDSLHITDIKRENKIEKYIEENVQKTEEKGQDPSTSPGP